MKLKTIISFALCCIITSCNQKTGEILSNHKIKERGIDQNIIKTNKHTLHYNKLNINSLLKNVEITYLGCSGFLINYILEAILIDPYFS